MLYLLYRFARPLKKLEDGRTVASAVLLAHNHEAAKEVIKEQIEASQDQRTQELLLRKHAEFINYAIKEWADELKTEVSVGYEFIDKPSITYSTEITTSFLTNTRYELETTNDSVDRSVKQILMESLNTDPRFGND